MKKSLEEQAMDGELDAEEYIRLTNLELEGSTYNAELRHRMSRQAKQYHADLRAGKLS